MNDVLYLYGGYCKVFNKGEKAKGIIHSGTRARRWFAGTGTQRYADSARGRERSATPIARGDGKAERLHPLPRPGPLIDPPHHPPPHQISGR